MSDIQKGYCVKTKYGRTVNVLEKLGAGGQGAVYKVDYDGKPKALKWYHKGYVEKLKDPQKVL